MWVLFCLLLNAKSRRRVILRLLRLRFTAKSLAVVLWLNYTRILHSLASHLESTCLSLEQTLYNGVFSSFTWVKKILHRAITFNREASERVVVLSSRRKKKNFHTRSQMSALLSISICIFYYGFFHSLPITIWLLTVGVLKCLRRRCNKQKLFETKSTISRHQRE